MLRLNSKNTYLKYMLISFIFIGIFNAISSSFLINQNNNNLLSLRYLEGNNKEKQIGNYKLKILGHSGKMRLSYTNSTENGTDTNSIEIDFDSLIERNNAGEEVGKSGKQKHSFNNFAQLDFQINDFVEKKFQNLSVFETSLVVKQFLENATFTAFVNIFNETGIIDTGANNSVRVNRGTMKFSVLIENWSFCSNNSITEANCVKGQDVEVGSYVDFTIKIKGKDSAKKTDSSQNKFSFGDSNVILANFIKIDNQDSKMPDGFPMFNSTENTNSFTFRFPKFNSSVYYDPVVEIVFEPEGSKFALIIILVILAFIVVGFGVYCLFFRKRPDESRANLI